MINVTRDSGMFFFTPQPITYAAMPLNYLTAAGDAILSSVVSTSTVRVGEESYTLYARRNGNYTSRKN